VLGDQSGQAGGVAQRADHVMSCVAEQASESLAQQYLVLDQYHAHGSSAVTKVPAASLRTSSLPPAASTRVLCQNPCMGTDLAFRAR